MPKDFKINLNQEQLQTKLNSPKLIYLYSKMDKDPSLVVDLCEFLFGEEQTQEVFNEFETVEELTDFLQDTMSMLNSTPSLPTEAIQEDILPKTME